MGDLEDIRKVVYSTTPHFFVFAIRTIFIAYSRKEVRTMMILMTLPGWVLGILIGLYVAFKEVTL